MILTSSGPLEKILVISLTSAPHLIELNPSLFIHVSPRLTSYDADANQLCCGYAPSVKNIVHKLSSTFRVVGIIVFVDCYSLSSFCPRDFPDAIPTVAVIGDTHHGTSPILPVVNWLYSVNINSIILKQTVAQHEFFESLGFKVFSFPYYLHQPIFTAPSTQVIPRAVFCGSLSSNHRFRTNMLMRLKNDSLPIDVVSCNRLSSYQLYNRYAISLNIPLGLDINYRHHEIIASGGFLLTENPCIDALKYSLLKPTQDYAVFTSYDDLVKRVTHLLSNLEFIYDVKCKSYHELKKSWEEKALLNILFKALDQCCPPRQLILTEEVKNTILKFETRQCEFLNSRNGN